MLDALILIVSLVLTLLSHSFWIFILFQSTIYLYVCEYTSIYYYGSFSLSVLLCYRQKIHHRKFMSISPYLVVIWQKRDATKSRIVVYHIQKTENANEILLCVRGNKIWWRIKALAKRLNMATNLFVIIVMVRKCAAKREKIVLFVFFTHKQNCV